MTKGVGQPNSFHSDVFTETDVEAVVDIIAQSFDWGVDEAPRVRAIHSAISYVMLGQPRLTMWPNFDNQTTINKKLIKEIRKYADVHAQRMSEGFEERMDQLCAMME